jgi:hypothetical protein
MYYVAIITIPFGGYVVATFCFKLLFFANDNNGRRSGCLLAGSSHLVAQTKQ